MLEVDDVGRGEFRLRRGSGRSGSDWDHFSRNGRVVEVTKRVGGFRSGGAPHTPSGELLFESLTRTRLVTDGSSDQPTFHPSPVRTLGEGPSMETTTQILLFHSTSVAGSAQWAKIPQGASPNQGTTG